MDQYKIRPEIQYQIPSKFVQYSRTDNAITLRVHSQISCEDHIKCVKHTNFTLAQGQNLSDALPHCKLNYTA
jgi:hypothetical protein